MKAKKLISVALVCIIISMNVGMVHSEPVDTDYISSSSENDREPTLVPDWNVNITTSGGQFSSLWPFMGPNENIYTVHTELLKSSIMCFDPNGTLEWEYDDLDEDETVSDMQFGENGNGYLHIYNRTEEVFSILALNNSGQFLWEKNIQSQTDFKIIGNEIYIGTSDGNIIKYDKTGEKILDKKIGDFSVSILGTIDDHLYLHGSNDTAKKLIKTDLNGQMIWEVNLNSNLTMSDFALGDAVYLCMEEQYAYSYTNRTIKAYEKDGEERWSRQVGQDGGFLRSIIWISDGLYFTQSTYDSDNGFDSSLFALDSSNGQNRWNFTFPVEAGEMLGQFFAGENDLLYTGVRDTSYDKNIIKNVYSFDPNGTVRYNLSVEHKNIVYFRISSQERFYTATKDGNITAFSLDRTPPIADAGKDRTVILDEDLELNASTSQDDTAIVNYTWGIQRESYYGPELNYSFNETGEYPVRLKVIDRAGRTDEVTVNITVEEESKADGGSDIYATQEIWLLGIGIVTVIAIAAGVWWKKY